VDDNVAGQAYVLPELVSSEASSCPVSIIKLTNSNSDSTDLVADFSTTITTDSDGNSVFELSSVATVAKAYSFYIYFSTVDGGVELFSSPVSLVVGCFNLNGGTVPTIGVTTASLVTG